MYKIGKDEFQGNINQIKAEREARKKFFTERLGLGSTLVKEQLENDKIYQRLLLEESIAEQKEDWN